MSLDDLSNLADALTFALLVTVSGLIAWTTIKATSRRPGLLRAPKVSMSVAAILAVALVGVAAWPAARETADPAARTDGGRMELGTTVAGAQPLLGPAPAQGVRARTLEGSTSTTDADVPSSSSVASGEPGSGSTIHPRRIRTTILRLLPRRCPTRVMRPTVSPTPHRGTTTTTRHRGTTTTSPKRYRRGWSPSGGASWFRR